MALLSDIELLLETVLNTRYFDDGAMTLWGYW